MRPQSGETYEPAVFSFSGRIGRVRYLAYSIIYGFLAALAGGVVISILAFLKSAAVGLMAPLILTFVVWAVGFISAKRRFNDMNYNSWFAILMMIPYLNMLVWLWLACARGSDGENDYGAPPCVNSRAVIAAACILPATAVIGILAAVAIPAYSDYVKRARAAQSTAAPAAVERGQ